MDNADNPCCKPKGTLIITIEPCNKGRNWVSDNEQNTQIVSMIPDEYNIPGLTPKTPRTMDIEIKIKGNDQRLFSDDKIVSQRESSISEHKPGKQKPLRPVKYQEKTEEIFSELELISHDFEGDNIVPKYQTEMVHKRKYSSESSESSEYSKNSGSVLLEKMTCPRTCPGKLICSAKKHFMGDKCKLHDPTYIGKQILEMHKNGKIRKISANIDKNLYPNFLLCTISEIQKLQARPKKEPKIERAKDDENKAEINNSINDDSSEIELEVLSIKDEKPAIDKAKDKEKDKEDKVKPGKPIEKKDNPKPLKPRTGSGCFC